MVDEESQKGRRAWWMRKVRRGGGEGQKEGEGG